MSKQNDGMYPFPDNEPEDESAEFEMPEMMDEDIPTAEPAENGNGGDVEPAEALAAGAVATATRPVSARSAHLAGKAEDIFRSLWASLFYSGKLRGKGVIVTSAARKEGATTIAAGLALSGSGPAGGERVALVDFNLRNPRIAELFGLPASPGLAEALSGRQDPLSVARPVNDSLDVYTLGSPPQRSLDLLRSQAVSAFFQQLFDRYDHVLVDTASANHNPDAQVLGGVVHDVVLVVNADVTPREAVAQAKKRIEAGGGHVAGVVLNQRRFPIPNFLYRRM